MIILLHSSKTMRPSPLGDTALRRPQLFEKACELAKYIKTLSPSELSKVMNISEKLANTTHELFENWTIEPQQQSLAIDSFVGDMYSGLQAQELSAEDREYADQTLRIFSGLYGILRPFDAICPYRLEMGYKLKNPQFSNLYDYWGNSIAECLPRQGCIVNLSAEEYSKTVTPFVESSRIITPKFLTVSPKTGEPKFVVVHAKIARGAFARWLIQSRTKNPESFKNFQSLGYRYDVNLSSAAIPTFVCEKFKGKGLSIKKRK